MTTYFSDDFLYNQFFPHFNKCIFEELARSSGGSESGLFWPDPDLTFSNQQPSDLENS
jgi:hypothetical protein